MQKSGGNLQIKNRYLKRWFGLGIVVLATVFGMHGVQAAVIDIVQQADGTFELFSNGERYGSASTRARAETVAQKLGNQGNTINWKTGTNQTPPNGFGTGSASTASTATSSAASGPKASINSNGTFRSEPFTRNGTQYVREETVGGQFRYKNVSTGKYVSNAEALGTNLPATTAKPGSNLPATTSQPASNLPAKPGNTPPGNTGGGGTVPPKAPTTAPKVNVGGVAMGAVGVVAGSMGMYDSVKSKETKATFGDIGTGAMGGLTAAAGVAAIVNAIPIGGQIAYGAAMAVGTVVGASGAAAKMFAETDCDMDPVTGQYACCNVSNLTNIKARYCNIGDEMFAEFPYVRTCMQGKNKTESSWLKARFLDDHWSDVGEIKFCSGYSMPDTDGDYKIQRYGSSEQEGKVCWKWECADEGYARSGAKCVPGTSNNTSTSAVNGGELDAVIVTASAIKAGDKCPDSRLPQYATAGVYIKNGKNPDTGLDKFTCAATACKDGTYLVINANGESQGWCAGQKNCPSGTTMNIIDGTKTDFKCVDAGGTVIATPDADNVPTVISDDVSNDITNDDLLDALNNINNNQNPCERGVPGYVMFEGKCITSAEHAQITAERAAREKQRRIDAATAEITAAMQGIEDIESKDLKISKWKDADGNFNTARLASDSIAGVVLGTAGGIITSSVVKKNQIKKGFEDISCTVGGQTVAGWGDTFTVGAK